MFQYEVFDVRKAIFTLANPWVWQISLW